MNDEIKEILDLLKYCVEKNEYLEEPNMKKWKPLLDYITNLQKKYEEADYDRHKLFEENERLKHQLKVQEDLTIKNRMRKHIYKSRCEKASEILQKYGNGTFDEDLLNILQNRSEKDD